MPFGAHDWSIKHLVSFVLSGFGGKTALAIEGVAKGDVYVCTFLDRYIKNELCQTVR